MSLLTAFNSTRSHFNLPTRQLHLFLFAIFVTLSCLGLGFLYIGDKTNNGFNIDASTPSYVWQFGSTAVLTVCIAFWSRVSNAMKEEAPWQEMSKGYVSADKSLLLDYISPLPTTVLYRAFMNQHWEVVLSIAVHTLLQLTMVFSTTLFRLEVAGTPFRTVELSLDTSRALGLTDGKDLTARYMRSESIGVQYMSVQQGLDFPSGAQADGAYQRLAVRQAHISSNATFVAEVPAAFSTVSCEPASATFQQTVIEDIWAVIQSDEWLKPENDSCLGWECDSNVPRIRRTWYSVWPSLLDTSDTVADRSGLDVRFEAVSHSFSTNAGFIYDPNCMDPASFCGTSNELRPFFQQVHLNNSTDYNGFVMGLYALTPKVGTSLDSRQSDNSTNSVQLSDLAINTSSVAICEIKYTQGSGRVEAVLDSPDHWSVRSLAKVGSSQDPTPQSFTNGNLSTEVSFAAQFTSFYQVGLTRPGMSDQHEAWFTLMKQASDTNSLSAFTDSQSLLEPARQILLQTAPNVLASFITFDKQTTTRAVFSRTRRVLRISRFSFWAMESLLLWTFLALCLLITRSWVLPRGLAPSWLMSSDLLVAKDSHNLAERLSLLASGSRIALKSAMRRTAFCARTYPSHSIQISDHQQCNEPVAYEDLRNPRDDSTYWSLAASQKYYSLCLIALAVLLIGSLEAAQRLSDKRSSRFLVKSTLGAEAGLLIPATVMLTAALLFSAGEFAALLLGRYLQLRRQSTILSQIDHPSLQRLLPVAIFTSFRYRQWSCALLMIAGLLGSTLTTVTAGLYTTTTDLTGTNHTVLSMDQFDVQAISKSLVAPNEQSSAAFATLRNFAFVEASNSSFVEGVWDEFAYPKVDLDALRRNYFAEKLQDVTAEVTLPSLRPTLKCWSVPREKLIVEIANRSTVGISPFVTGSKTMNIFSVFNVPSGCPDLGENISNSDPQATYYATTTFVLDKSDSYLMYAGAVAPVQDIATGGVARSSKVTPDFARTWPGKFQAPDCPTFAAFTVYKPEAQSTAVMVNHILCTEGVEEVNARLTYNLSSGALQDTPAPVVDESSASAKPGKGLAGLGVSLFAYALDPATLNQQYDRTFDGFFSALVYGPDGIPIQNLVQPNQTDLLANATQHIYRQYFAQYANQMLRTNGSTARPDNLTLSSRGTGDVFTPVGTRFSTRVVDRSVKRLVQNRIPNIILQTLIAAMVICSASGYRALLEMGRLVRHNPCHLAGRLSLWVDSQVVKDLQASEKASMFEVPVARDPVNRSLDSLRLRLVEVGELSKPGQTDDYDERAVVRRNEALSTASLQRWVTIGYASDAEVEVAPWT